MKCHAGVSEGEEGLPVVNIVVFGFGILVFLAIIAVGLYFSINKCFGRRITTPVEKLEPVGKRDITQSNLKNYSDQESILENIKVVPKPSSGI